MQPNQLIDQAKTKMDAAVSRFSDDLKKLRTGRASGGMLDGVKVEAYGTSMPLNQVGNVIAPEPQLIQITPFDPANLQAISNAIRDDQSLGLNPVDDGRVVRIQVPPLTTERRQQIVKQLNEKLEDCMIGLRQARQDAMKHGDQAKKDKDWGDDDHHRFEKQIDDLMASHKTQVEQLAKAKEQDVMTV